MPQFADGNFNFSFPKGFEGFDPKDMPELKDLPRVPSLMGRVPEGPDAPEPFVFAFGNRRQIGVGLTPLTKQLGEHFGVDSGAMVNNVREDSPAAKAGLKAGDIIVGAEGKAVKGEMDVIRAIADKKDGEITLTVIRDKNRLTISVTPEESKGGENFFEFQKPPSAPNSPAAPGVYRMTVPRSPGSPAVPAMPLNQMMIPGRVI
jgi:membrane-associated protease RseP (regulator of RpoE activity)